MTFGRRHRIKIIYDRSAVNFYKKVIKKHLRLPSIVLLILYFLFDIFTNAYTTMSSNIYCLTYYLKTFRNIKCMFKKQEDIRKVFVFNRICTIG